MDKMKLQAAIDAAIESEQFESVPAIVSFVLKSQPDLIRDMTPDWQKAALAALVRARLRRNQLTECERTFLR
jgi:hypothetical protein